MTTLATAWESLCAGTSAMDALTARLVLSALDCLQWDTLEIALDQAKAILGVPLAAWSTCLEPVPESTEFDTGVFARCVSGR